METTAVEISVDPVYGTHPENQMIVFMLTTLIARCFGRVSLRDDAAGALTVTTDPVLVSAAESLGATVTALVTAIQGTVDRPRPERTLHINVGPNPPRPWIASIGGWGWRGVLWPAHGAPISYNGRPNPLGAFVAALLGATQVTREFIEEVTQAPGDAHKPITATDGGVRARYALPLGQVTISAYDFLEHGVVEPAWSARDLGVLTLVSVGAVNGAALYLMRAAGLRATVIGYEPQDLDRTNLNRYVYALACQERRAKAAAAEQLATSELAIRVHRQSIEEISGVIDSLVLCGVDNNVARWETQRRSTGWLLSLESEESRVTFTMHAPADGACARCAHPSDLAPDPEQPTHPVVSAWLGLLAMSALVRGERSWTPGLQIRFDGLDPRDRATETIRAMANCPLSHERGLAQTQTR
jgi:hypothetical protein